MAKVKLPKSVDTRYKLENFIDGKSEEEKEAYRKAYVDRETRRLFPLSARKRWATLDMPAPDRIEDI